VGGTCGTHGGEERCLQGFGWEARRRRWKDSMKMDLREIGIDGAKGLGWLRIECSGGLL
jgi:hypothetical protein